MASTGEEASQAEEVQKALQGIASESHHEEVELVISLPIGLGQLRQIMDHLTHIENLSTLRTSGSLDKGLIITVSGYNPTDLIHILNTMPSVENVNLQGKRIVVMLKPPGVS